LLHPVHHAFELFFKATISSQQFAIPKHHNLIALYNCYHECFKDPAFAFAIPFGLDDDSPFRVGEESFKNLDEFYRYKVDNRRFIPETFQVELQNHRKEFDRLTPLIVDSASHPPMTDRRADRTTPPPHLGPLITLSVTLVAAAADVYLLAATVYTECCEWHSSSVMTASASWRSGSPGCGARAWTRRFGMRSRRALAEDRAERERRLDQALARLDAMPRRPYDDDIYDEYGNPK
jgi:hypothetical protein